MNGTYWIGWAIITAIYLIAWLLTRRAYEKRISILEALLGLQQIQIEMGREIARNYTKDVEAYKKQIEELKGANGE
jgi:hypothetical protein